MANKIPLRADVLLSDGRVATIRPANALDHAGLLSLHLRASDRSLWLRFFTSGATASRAYLEHLRTSTTTTAFVAEVSGTIVGLGTAEVVDADVEEVAFLVDDSWHGLGVASHLLEHLAADARARGVSRLTAAVLRENHRMLSVFLDAGFTTTRSSSDGIVTVTLDPSATEAYVEATTAREASSEHASLAPLLAPRSIAMLGVRRNGTGVGAAVLRSVRAAGYTGSLWVIHPSGEQVAGLVTYRTLGELETPPDLAIVTTPGSEALAAVTDAATVGVRAAVVLSSGFDETGRRGTALQRRMLRVAREHSMRLVGPNCLGIVLNEPSLRLNATFQRFMPPPGGLAIATQSGGVGIVLMDTAQRRALGVRYFISLGNKADVSSNDLLSAWMDDPGVTVGALYLESFGNARSFARLAHGFSERKPLLAVVGGRSAGGARAGASHTAAALTGAVGVQALFTQAGVVECLSADELVDTSAVFAEQPRPEGRRLGILSNAGGMGVLAADAADRCGLTVPRLPRTARARLSRLVQGTTGTSNPVDVGAGADASRVARAVEVLLAAEEVDALLLVLVGTEVSDARAALREVARTRLAHPRKPVLVVPLGGVEVPPEVRCTGDRPGLTELPSIDAAVIALAHVNRYQEWRRLPRASLPPPSGSRVRTTREGAQRLLSGRGPGWLDPEEAGTLVCRYGVRTVGTVVRGLDAAVEEAERIGYPVAVKVAAADVLHRTERGLVRVGLTDIPGTEQAVRSLAAASGTPVDELRVWMQPVRRGVELALGIVRHETFGPLVMVAAGGVATDVLADRVFLLPPFDSGVARHGLRSLRTAPLFRGYRGSPAIDEDSVCDLVVSLGQLALEVPEVAELDLNPVLAHPQGADIVDMKLRIAAASGLDEGLLRQLGPRV